MPTRHTNSLRFFALALMLPMLLLNQVQAADNKNTGQTAKQASQEKGALPLEDLRAFTDAMQRIKEEYVEPVDDKTLLENAIRGMLGNLDPHSAYLSKEDFKNLEESTSGEFGGLGIEIGSEDGMVKVITPIDDTPAQKAGVKAGDIIIRLDDVPLRGLGLKKSVEMMRGKAGEPIKLTVMRKGASQPLDIVVVRDIIRVKSVKHRTLEPGLGYVRISQFQTDTGREVLQAMDKLAQQQPDKQLNGLVLDLRNNPGGVLQAAVDVSDIFLSQGLIVYTKGRIQSSRMSYSANAKDPSGGIPLVVLVNGGSASASEIVAGALQDHRRGIVIGTRSFGKGSVQTVKQLGRDSERGLKLTTALYYTPNGRSIQAEGIVPDIKVDDASITRVEDNDAYREADLKGHLDNTGKKDSKDKSGNNDPKQASLEDSDFQLSQALNILKSLYLAQSMPQPKATAGEK